MPRKNRSGIDWSDPAARRAYNAEIKRRNLQHHDYNRQYSKEHYEPTPVDELHQIRTAAGKASAAARLASGKNKLTPDDVRAIRASAESSSQLARMYDVGIMTISDIRNYKTWKDVL